ncbi:hypothetical protein NSP_12420 [Nodularia spumigena CCY9414]|nr:hypothetical protein NSP_12420 [Nodularia spumigena CCY9414]
MRSSIGENMSNAEFNIFPELRHFPPLTQNWLWQKFSLSILIIPKPAV